MLKECRISPDKSMYSVQFIFLRLDKRFPDVFVIVRTHRNQLKPLVDIFLRGRRTPGAPEIHQDNFAAQGGIGNSLALVRGKGEIGCERFSRAALTGSDV
jgi:hypothetical protein